MKYGSSPQLGKWRKTAQVKTGILRSVGLIFLGKGKRHPQQEERVDTAQVHQETGRARGEQGRRWPQPWEWPRCPLGSCLRRGSPSTGTFQWRSEHTLWPKRPTYSNLLSPIFLPELAIFQNQENIHVNRDGRVAVTAKFEEINMTWELFRAVSTVRRQ